MATLRVKQTSTETATAPISPAGVIQGISEIRFQSTHRIRSCANSEMNHNVCGGPHLIDTVDVKAMLPINLARRVLVHAEPSNCEASSSSGSPASSPTSEVLDGDTSLSSSYASQTPVANLKSILKNPIGPRTPQTSKPTEFDLEDNVEYDSDSDMDDDDDDDEEEEEEEEVSGGYKTGTSDSNRSDEGDENEYSDDEGSFICFVNSVHFSAKDDIRIIPCRDEIVDGRAEPEMTFHEQALRMRGSKRVPFQPYTVNGKDYDPNEHSRDVIELDKQLFIAYVNGIRNMNVEDYRPVVLTRTLNATSCDIDFLPTTEHQVNAYLDRVVDSALGFFPYLFGKDEYNRILDDAEVVTSFDDYNNVLYKPDSGLFQQAITRQLESKLADTAAIIENDILDWVAGELIEPLGRHASFRWG
ncbi:conserved hypothetical protein [Histoplasma capsulatum var. duboisii H88]|uniref:Uncharacterized protein n=1 Tax=Ajellomyces capsulatus (strain H88) TaxID=544711 RepID=F0U613_AJEC8|nr:conserved hypothetical protein [Histoplasma capsulatum var. duboisii H88]QSS52169.1 hypothetical protein I7I53_07706 [Histoplasma capsulatum var. duboisii H88]